MNYQTRYLIRRKVVLLLCCLIWVATCQAQKELPPLPNPPKLVSDFSSLLSSAEKNRLEKKLVAFNDSTSIQLAIVIENTLEGDDIFEYSQRLAEEWGIGNAGRDNGILIYIALQDRRLRIHPGYGAESFLTDAMSKRIIDNTLVPAFRSERYYRGLDRATDIIMSLSQGEYKPMPSSQGFNYNILIFLIIILIALFIINKILQNKDHFDNFGDGGGYWREGHYDSYGPRKGKQKTIIISRGGGFGSSGGFGGFGGGSFGGGGASGGW